MTQPPKHARIAARKHSLIPLPKHVRIAALAATLAVMPLHARLVVPDFRLAATEQLVNVMQKLILTQQTKHVRLVSRPAMSVQMAIPAQFAKREHSTTLLPKHAKLVV